MAEPGTAANRMPHDDGNVACCSVQQQAELSGLQQQLQLKHEEVLLLQAQVERLSGLLDTHIDAQEQRPHEADVHQQQQLQQQLDATRAELQHTRSLLEQVMQEGSAAVKAASEQRSGAMRLLLVEHIKALQQAEQERAEAQQLAADKADDCEAMRAALAAANTHILVLTAATAGACAGPQQQLQETQGDTAAGSQHQRAETASKQQDQAHEELQHQLAVQKQQLQVAHEQLKELLQHLALQRDCADFERRRAAVLQQQLQDAQQIASAAALAATPPDPRSQHGCASSAVNSASGRDTDSPRQHSALPLPQQPSQQQQQQQLTPQTQPAAVEQHGKSMGLAGSLSAALSNAISLSGPKADEREAPSRTQSPQPLNAFTLARNFVIGREAEELSRLKDQLREQEQEVSALSATKVQLEGLQTVLVAKVSQCNRLEREVKELHKQLRQAEAAAASDQEAMVQQLSQLSDRVTEAQAALAASMQREQQLQTQLAATRAKLAQVLEALVDEAAALQQHRPAHYKQLANDMPAAMADVMAAAAAAASAQGANSSGTSRTASVLSEGSPDSFAALRQLWQASEGAASRKGGLQQQATRQSVGAAASQDDTRHFGLRSFMRSQTHSSHGGSPSGSSNGRAGGGGGPADHTGSCVVAGVQVQPTKPSGSMWPGQGAAAAEAGPGAQQPVSTPRQTAAAKMKEVWKLLKKGKEQEQGGQAAAATATVPAAGAAANRVSASSDDFVYDELMEDECSPAYGTSCR